ncbi:hypothetical protein JMN32_18910 [Fulvivirga sp. 29W222]|uniref:Uncharacterized protein n=1 Tax=Fulvivirga marina TaxID=2494733 RepID=A0A937G0Q0_9BACT|nr:hypothetical protein [Fulvivirga marina]MBL6448392.1 hypothetical protein [Fulvivirga marina]
MEVKQPTLKSSKYMGLLQDLITHTSTWANSFWVCGSRAIGTNKIQSDLDICFLLKPGIAKEQFKAHLSEVLDCNDNYPEYFTTGKTEVWWCEDGEVSVKLFTMEEIKNLIAIYENADIELFLKNQALIQHKFISSHILYDADNLVANYCCLFLDANRLIFRVVAQEFLNRLNNKLTWWNHRKNWKNEFEHLMDLAVIVDEIAQIHYALNYKLKMEGLKEYHNDLNTLLPCLKPEMEAIVNLNKKDYAGGEKKKLIGSIYFKLSDFYDQHELGFSR